MSKPKPLLECVPNFSEGQSEEVLDALKQAITAIPGQQLLHIDQSPAANRTVFTFAGEPSAVIEAAYQAIKTAASLIDMRFQKGTHPRLGATDVCPLIPLANMSMEEAVHWANELGKKVGEILNIPVYLYEHAARENYRRALPDVRKGQYEGLNARIQLPEWQPDYGPSTQDDWKSIERTGATIIGARDVLVAFNISLNTKDERIAAHIAKQMRTSSNGLLPALRAIGWYMEDFECAQVSMNLLDYRITSPLKVWETCKSLAALHGLEPIGCEVIGLIPEVCVLEAGSKALAVGNWQLANDVDRKKIIEAGIDYLGLDRVKPFIAEEKILEYALAKAGLT
jgi:glutamate formiminotransferase/formiminotetrahydrofolate cyclodeaminase